MGAARHGIMRHGWARVVATLGPSMCLACAPRQRAGITNSGERPARRLVLQPAAAVARRRRRPAPSGSCGRPTSTGQIYAQPLVVGSTVIVVTEGNQVYALDSETGARSGRATSARRSRRVDRLGLRRPDAGPRDHRRRRSSTRRPNTIYLTYKTYAPGSTTAAALLHRRAGRDHRRAAHRLPAALRRDRPERAGRRPSSATTELQRPGLLLMDGVVYAGFGGHCDITPYQGWVFGVNATTGAVTARWSALDQAATAPGSGSPARA